MTRDYQKSSKSSANNQSSGQSQSQYNQQQHHHHHHHNHHKIVQFEPFCLLSEDDRLLKQAAELVETASLSRFKVCIVSIISKEPLDFSIKDQLTQSILNNGSDKRRQRGKQHQAKVDQLSKATEETSNITTKTNKFSLPVDCDYENQVVGHVDSKAGVIVLNLTSFTDTNRLHSLSEIANGLFGGDNRSELETESLLSSVWPTWNQNLLKTLLILFTVSHIVVFYNPELSMDYNLLQTFKILETFRLKSQARITDLLETIASKQMFPQAWIRQARVACPRALFVCDTSCLDISINQSEVANVKRDLEDQIYKLLKKTNILARPLSNSIQTGLLCLPERDDFVFLVTKRSQYSSRTAATTTTTTSLGTGVEPDDLLVEQRQRELFYSNLFKSLGLCDLDKVNEKEEEGDDNGKSQPVSDCDERLSQDETSAIQQPEIRPTMSSGKSNLTAQQNRFRKFLNKHIADIQALSQIDQQDNKSGTHNSTNNTTTNTSNNSKQANLLLPRYDDFFAVLLRLKGLLFPPSKSTDCDPEATIEKLSITTGNSGSSHIRPSLWMATPDERRFVDIYDLVNNDELFSKRLCRKTRLAAFDYYCRDLRAQACAPTMTQQAHHESVLDSARRLYLNHARGSACAHNLDLLIDQCNLYWQNLGHSANQKPSAYEENKDGGRNFPRGSNRLCKTTSSDVVPSAHSSSSLAQNSRSSLTILRRANGIKVTTTCECGRQSNFMVTPVDRKKKLERVDIYRTND